MEDIPKRPYLSSFIQFKGTKLKKSSIQGIFGENCLAHNPRVQSSKVQTQIKKR
jgi:hypothetical protein